MQKLRVSARAQWALARARSLQFSRAWTHRSPWRTTSSDREASAGALLQAAVGRRHRCDRDAGQRRPHRCSTTCWRRRSVARSIPSIPKRDSVLGIKAYRSVARHPGDRRPGRDRDAGGDRSLRDRASAPSGACRRRSIISAGFRETGAAGAELERQILAEARRGRMRIIGPNCLGVMSPLTGLNATFAAGMARPGNVAFLSQSGALLTAILDWSLREQVGFSAFVSLGSMLDVGWGDLIDYLGERSAHARHRHLHGVDRRRARVSVGGARGGADQADHRDQGGAQRGRQPRRRVAHRVRSPARTTCSTRPFGAAACSA